MIDAKLLAKIRQLDFEDRVRLGRMICEEVAAESTPLTKAQMAELQRRLDKYGDSTEGTPWEEVERKLIARKRMARLPIRMRPEAEDEVDQAHLWYENQRKGRGTKFRRAVREKLRFIARFPLAGLEVMPGVRRVVLKDHPYIVIYRLLESGILVESVFNTHQDPRKWQERIQSFDE